MRVGFICVCVMLRCILGLMAMAHEPILLITFMASVGATCFLLFAPKPSYPLYLPENQASKCSRTALTAIFEILLTSVNVLLVVDAIDSGTIISIASYSLTAIPYSLLLLVFTYAYPPSPPTPPQHCLGIRIGHLRFPRSMNIDEIMGIAIRATQTSKGIMV